MASVAVRELRQKLKLLIELGAFPSHQELAKRGFERSESTVYGWCTDARERRAGSMPSQAFEKLLGFFGPLLPGLSPSLLRGLLLGPISHLADALRKDHGGSLMRLIKSEAVRQGKLYIKSKDLGLAEIDRAHDHEAIPIRIGEGFRLEYPSQSNLPYVLVVQNVGMNWGLFDPTRLTRVVHVPGVDSDGNLEYLVEREQPGLHRFVCFQANLPFPERLIGYANEVVLDKQGLELLTSFYLSQPRDRRVCQLISLIING